MKNENTDRDFQVDEPVETPTPAPATKRPRSWKKQAATELDAMNECYAALRPFRVEQRNRVIEAVKVLLDMNGSDEGKEPQREYKPI